MKKLYRYYVDIPRQGAIEGVFVSNEDEINSLEGAELYFGEALGKHSCICLKFKTEDLSTLSTKQNFVEEFEETVGSIGYNPLDYIA